MDQLIKAVKECNAQNLLGLRLSYIAYTVYLHGIPPSSSLEINATRLYPLPSLENVSECGSRKWC